MSAHTKSRRRPRTGPMRFPRGTKPLAVAVAAVMASVPVGAQAPVPPEGTVIITVGLSTGTAVLPVAGGVLPLICEPATGGTP